MSYRTIHHIPRAIGRHISNFGFVEHRKNTFNHTRWFASSSNGLLLDVISVIKNHKPTVHKPGNQHGMRKCKSPDDVLKMLGSAKSAPLHDLKMAGTSIRSPGPLKFEYLTFSSQFMHFPATIHCITGHNVSYYVWLLCLMLHNSP